MLVPDAMVNPAPMPGVLTDEQVLMCPDIMSTGFGGAECGGIRIGDTVVVLALGPIGLCAGAGARLSGATIVIGPDRLPALLETARRMGADHVIASSRAVRVKVVVASFMRPAAAYRRTASAP
jgi:alcohol dehydrogenase